MSEFVITSGGSFVVWVYSQIAGDMNYQLMLGDQLIPGFSLGSLHDLYTFCYGLNTG